MMWFMDHPWMTFILALTALLVVEEAAANICKVVVEIWHTKERMKTTKFSENQEEKQDAEL